MGWMRSTVCRYSHVYRLFWVSWPRTREPQAGRLALTTADSGQHPSSQATPLRFVFNQCIPAAPIQPCSAPPACLQMVELRTTEMANSDLEKYHKVLQGVLPVYSIPSLLQHPTQLPALLLPLPSSTPTHGALCPARQALYPALLGIVCSPNTRSTPRPPPHTCSSSFCSPLRPALPPAAPAPRGRRPWSAPCSASTPARWRTSTRS